MKFNPGGNNKCEWCGLVEGPVKEVKEVHSYGRLIFTDENGRAHSFIKKTREAELPATEPESAVESELAADPEPVRAKTLEELFAYTRKTDDEILAERYSAEASQEEASFARRSLQDRCPYLFGKEK